MSDKITDKILMWLLGLIGALLLTAIGGGFKFYYEWSTDEAVEDALKEQEKPLMFDDVQQKIITTKHPFEVPSALEQQLKIERDSAFQQQMLNKLKDQDCLLIRLNDQYYQLNQKIQDN